MQGRQYVQYLHDYPNRNNSFIKSSTPQLTSKLKITIASDKYMMLEVLIQSLLIVRLFMALALNNY